MKRLPISNQEGMALLQVLLFSAMIVILAMQIARSGHSQVVIAQGFQDRVSATLALRSQEAELLYALSTYSWSPRLRQDESLEQSALPRRWNFHGQPFELAPGVTATIQDDAGLVSIFRGGNATRVESILSAELGSRSAATAARKALVDAQGYDRADKSGQFFQSEYEVLKVLSRFGDSRSFEGLFTRMPYGDFNPMTAPDRVLRALLSERVASAIIEKRQAQGLTEQQFSSLTGIVENDGISFWPSGRFRITLVSEFQTARVVEQRFLQLTPRAVEPFWDIGVKG